MVVRPSYLSSRVRDYFRESESLNDNQDEFKPFQNERDTLNRLIGSPIYGDHIKNQQPISKNAKALGAFTKKVSMPHLSLSIDTTINYDSLTGPCGLFKKKTVEMKHVKHRHVPAEKSNSGKNAV